MVQFRVVVAVVKACRGTADVAADPVIVVHAADREHADVVVDETPDRRRGADRRAVRLDVRPDLGMRVAGDTEHADTRRTGALERLQVGGGEPQRRMRALDRPRHHLARRQVEMLALVAGEMLLLEHLHHRLQRLATHLAAVFGIGVEAETFHDVGRRAASGAELAAAVGQHVQRRDALGDHERVVARHQDHREAEPDRARALRQRGEEHLGAGGVADLGEEVLLGEPEMTEPGLLRRDHVVEVLPVDVALGVLGPGLRHLDLAQQAEFHLSLSFAAGQARLEY